MFYRPRLDRVKVDPIDATNSRQTDRMVPGRRRAKREKAESVPTLADRIPKAYGRTVAYLLVMSTFALVTPAIAFGPGDAPQLSEVRAIELMGAALISHYPVSWRKARGHNLACPIAFHAQHGGKTQDEELRRCCRFAWEADEIEFHGCGMVWLGGISSVDRDWHSKRGSSKSRMGMLRLIASVALSAGGSSV